MPSLQERERARRETRRRTSCSTLRAMETGGGMALKVLERGEMLRGRQVERREQSVGCQSPTSTIIGIYNYFGYICQFPQMEIIYTLRLWLPFGCSSFHSSLSFIPPSSRFRRAFCCDIHAQNLWFLAADRQHVFRALNS